MSPKLIEVNNRCQHLVTRLLLKIHKQNNVRLFHNLKDKQTSEPIRYSIYYPKHLAGSYIINMIHMV